VAKKTGHINERVFRRDLGWPWRDVSGTSVDTSLPRRRIIIAIFAELAVLTTF
jgi:hypothetical protein